MPGGSEQCGLLTTKWHQLAILGLTKAKRFYFLVMRRRATWEPMHCGKFIFHAEVSLNTCEIQEQIVMHIETDRRLQLLLLFFASSNLGGLLCPSQHFYFSFFFHVPYLY